MTMTAPMDRTARSGHYRITQVARSEITKILTLRSTAIMVALTSVASLLVTILATRAVLHHGHSYYVGFDPTQESLTGVIVAVLTGGVFGALLITGEYSSGTMRATLAAVPKRRLLLSAKLGVTAVLGLVFSEVLAFACFFLGQAILRGGGAPSASLATPGAARAVIMSGVFIALIALMSFGFGLIVRSAVGAVAAFVGVMFVLPLVMHGISESGVKYLPTNILTQSVMATVGQGQGPYLPVTPAVGLVLMTLYAAAALAVGAVVFVKRDA